ncbi:MAG: hypothetical protein WCR75_08105, partial [Sphaerochaetaceae bacterium]
RFSPVLSRTPGSPGIPNLAFTSVRELTWKPLHFRRIHIPQTAKACSVSLFPSLIDFTKQVPPTFRFSAYSARCRATLHQSA